MISDRDALDKPAYDVRTLLEQATRECELGDRPVRLKVCVQPGDLRATGVFSADDCVISQPHLCQRVRVLRPTPLDFDE